MTDKVFDVRDFRDWVATQSGEYNYVQPHNCALARYARAKWGVPASVLPAIGEHDTGTITLDTLTGTIERVNYPGYIEDVLKSDDFGTLLQELDGLLVEHAND